MPQRAQLNMIELVKALQLETDPTQINSLLQQFSQNLVSIEQNQQHQFQSWRAWYFAQKLHEYQTAKSQLQDLLLIQGLLEPTRLLALYRLLWVYWTGEDNNSCRRILAQAFEINKGNKYPSLRKSLYAIFTQTDSLQEETSQNYLIRSVLAELRQDFQQALILQRRHENLLLQQKYQRTTESDRQLARFRISSLEGGAIQSMKSQASIRNQLLMNICMEMPQITSAEAFQEQEDQREKLIGRLTQVCQKYRRYGKYTQEVKVIQQTLSYITRQGIPFGALGLLDHLLTKSNINGDYRSSFLQKQPKSQSVTDPNTQLLHPVSHIHHTASIQIQEDPREIQYDPKWFGSVLTKAHYDSSGEEIRYFYLEDSKLYYCAKDAEPNSKKDDYYPLKGLQEVVLGKKGSQVLQKKEHRNKDDKLCFYLVFKDRTRDFCALDFYDFANWTIRLEKLLDRKQSKKPRKVVSIQQQQLQELGSVSQVSKKKTQKGGTLILSKIK